MPGKNNYKFPPSVESGHDPDLYFLLPTDTLFLLDYLTTHNP